MPQKTNKKSPSSSVAAPRPGRGRPRKIVDPEALTTFERQKVTSKNVGNQENKNPPVTKRKGKSMNPVTSDRNYSMDEVEFMNALAEFKRVSGRTFPTCSEILSILRSLGYEKVM